jgi:hypothetical protein
MLLWLLAYWTQLGSTAATSEAEQAGRAIGGAIGSGMLLTMWALGDIILGLFVLLSRGRKTIIEETVQP